MIAVKISEVKSFMSKLLGNTVFDNFLLSELTLSTYNNFQISGALNEKFFSEEEKQLLDGRKYSKWSEIRPIAYELMKGKKTPIAFKIVFLLSSKNLKRILSDNEISFKEEEINGLVLNIRYELEELKLTTGTSLKIFTMDKTLERVWDEDLKKFLKHYEILFEEE